MLSKKHGETITFYKIMISCGCSCISHSCSSRSHSSSSSCSCWRLASAAFRYKNCKIDKTWIYNGYKNYYSPDSTVSTHSGRIGIFIFLELCWLILKLYKDSCTSAIISSICQMFFGLWIKTWWALGSRGTNFEKKFSEFCSWPLNLFI